MSGENQAKKKQADLCLMLQDDDLRTRLAAAVANYMMDVDTMTTVMAASEEERFDVFFDDTHGALEMIAAIPDLLDQMEFESEEDFDAEG